jgi:hypothetical protein
MFQQSLPKPRRGNGFSGSGFRAASSKITAIRSETAILCNKKNSKAVLFIARENRRFAPLRASTEGVFQRTLPIINMVLILALSRC